jgi:cell division protein FtsL
MRPAAQARGWRNRPLVREPDGTGARSLWRVLGGLAIALSPAVVCVVEQNECLRVSYELSTARAEQETLRKEEQRLRVERARLESYARIETWALDERGLAAPTARQVIVLPVGDGAEPERLLASWMVHDAH